MQLFESKRNHQDKPAWSASEGRPARVKGSLRKEFLGLRGTPKNSFLRRWRALDPSCSEWIAVYGDGRAGLVRGRPAARRQSQLTTPRMQIVEWLRARRIGKTRDAEGCYKR